MARHRVITIKALIATDLDSLLQWQRRVTYSPYHKWIESCHVSARHVTNQWLMSKYLVITSKASIFLHTSSFASMSSVIHQGVISHMNESCHTSTNHITYDWVMSHINEACHVWMSQVEIPSHQGQDINCCTPSLSHEWVVSHINESYHIWMCHVTYQRFMLHINDSCYIQPVPPPVTFSQARSKTRSPNS